jgi:DNA-binding response OmpR family regulator
VATDQEHAARILIVEDALGIAEALQRALTLFKDGSYLVEISDSGEAALKRLMEAPFDLLITDLRLPGLDGLELLERVRRLGSPARTMLITAYGSPEIEAQTRELANSYLAKPFALRDLLREVDLLLSEPVPVAPPVSERKDISPQPMGISVAVDQKKVVHFKVLAFDLDGTLAEANQVAPQTWEALRAARLAGQVLILVTGRTLDSFISEFPFAELCEAMVVENGAVVYFPRRDAVILPFGEVDSAVFQRLQALDVPLDRGIAIAATRVPHDAEIFRVLQAIRTPLTVEYNRDSVMLLPPGASKGQGLLFALQELGYSPHNLLVCGDAENDRSMFDVAEFAVAVAKRTCRRSIADAILEKRDGEGYKYC